MSSATTSLTQPESLIAANEVLLQFTRLHHATSSPFSCSKTHDHIQSFYVPGETPPNRERLVFFTQPYGHALPVPNYVGDDASPTLVVHWLYIVWALTPYSSPSNLRLVLCISGLA